MMVIDGRLGEELTLGKAFGSCLTAKEASLRPASISTPTRTQKMATERKVNAGDAQDLYDARSPIYGQGNELLWRLG